MRHDSSGALCHTVSYNSHRLLGCEVIAKLLLHCSVVFIVLFVFIVLVIFILEASQSFVGGLHGQLMK